MSRSCCELMPKPSLKKVKEADPQITWSRFQEIIDEPQKT